MEEHKCICENAIKAYRRLITTNNFTKDCAFIVIEEEDHCEILAPEAAPDFAWCLRLGGAQRSIMGYKQFLDLILRSPVCTRESARQALLRGMPQIIDLMPFEAPSYDPFLWFCYFSLMSQKDAPPEQPSFHGGMRQESESENWVERISVLPIQEQIILLTQKDGESQLIIRRLDKLLQAEEDLIANTRAHFAEDFILQTVRELADKEVEEIGLSGSPRAVDWDTTEELLDESAAEFKINLPVKGR